MSTILEAFGLRKVAGYRSGHGIVEGYPLPDQLVGIELEIEHFPIDWSEASFGGFTFTEDGSLRNRGCEAITKPVAVKHVRGLLEAFYSAFGIRQERNYSERCSTHVHFNVLPLTTEQVSTICLIYQTVESLLFRWVGEDRENNIFCVPWNQCNLNYSVVTKMAGSPANANDVFRRWQKYAALNLIPIAEQGTMEFRHLYGTCDVQKIVQWISIISQIFLYAEKTTLEEAQRSIINMNTVSNYHQWMRDVFGDLAEDLKYDGYEKQLSVGVVDSKLMLMKQDVRPMRNIEAEIGRRVAELRAQGQNVYAPINWATEAPRVDIFDEPVNQEDEELL